MLNFDMYIYSHYIYVDEVVHIHHQNIQTSITKTFW